MTSRFGAHFLERYGHHVFGCVLLCSLVVKYIYVFHYTGYQGYLVSDMGAYWERATTSLTEGNFDEGQWAIWPPFAHMTLAWYFKILSLFGLSDSRLELTLTANIILSVLASAGVYLIALKLYPSKIYALLTGTLYAFFFPLVYLNAFVLSEHLSVAALLLSIVLILYARRCMVHYFAAGVVLAFAIGIRPNFGVLGLPLFVYIVFSDVGSWWRRLLYASVFTVGYALFLLHIIADNASISGGKMSFLSAGGGISYYLAACEPYELVTHYNGLTWSISAPAQAGSPENGIANMTEPFYHQQYYYRLGRQCREHRGYSWWAQIKRYRHFFQDAFFPYVYNALFAKRGIPIFSNIALGMTLLLLFFPLLFFDKKISKNTWVLVGGIVFLQGMLYSVYAIEGRYLYGFFFAIDLLSILILFRLTALGRRLTTRQRFVAILLWVLVGLLVWRNATALPAHRPIRMHLAQDSRSLKQIDQPRHTTGTLDTRINTIAFKDTYTLRHDDWGDFGFEKNFFIDFSTAMHILKEGDYTFVVSFDDGFRLDIDHQHIMDASASGDIAVRRKRLHLFPNRSLPYRLSFYQSEGDLGIRAYYAIDGKRFLIGVDSPYIHFHDPESNITRPDDRTK